MRKKLNIAVICGGRSGEHEVSLQSAASVIAALDPAKYSILPVRIDRAGRWLRDQSLLPAGQAKTLMSGKRSGAVLAQPGSSWLNGANRRAVGIDVAIPLVHGTGGEDGCLQGLLELASIPYVGSGVLGSAVGMDKAVQKKILEREKLPVVPWLDFTDEAWQRNQEGIVRDIINRFGFPVFVKPANLGSSVGISKAHHLKELLAAIRLALSYDLKVVVEKSVERAREIECAVLGSTDAPETSVLGEIVPSNEFYDYEAKYIDGRSQALIPAPLPPALAAFIRQLAARTFTALEAYGLARVDFLLSRDKQPKVYLNEINTLPGFTSISMFPKLWAASGLSYGRLIDKLIALALKRGRRNGRLTRIYAPGQSGGKKNL
ncbi:MAG: D-alanine--D-alanine ligase family protein [Patescibacteria group bacterium]|jgi:D-alanine-D-alanine ligase